MQVLVAGRNAKILAKAAGTFAADLEIHTAATKAASFALLERVKFDLIVACETLSDGSGLEVLSHAAVNTPNTLRVFAARPATLVLLKGELGLFGLFRTLPYPINFRKLWAAINLARSTCVDEPAPPRTRPQPPPAFDTSIRVTATTATRVKLPRQPAAAKREASPAITQGSSAPAKRPLAAAPPRSAQRQAPVGPARARPPANASQPTRNTGTPADMLPAAQRGVTPANEHPAQHPVATPANARRAQHPVATPANEHPAQQRAATPATRAASTPHQQAAAPQTPVPTRVTAIAPKGPPPASAPREITSGMRAAARYAAAHAGKDIAPAKSARIPESDAFKRARARRDSGRLEPVVTNESLAQLAKLAATRRPNPAFRAAPPGKRRSALVVGSGVFAATTAAVLTFFMVSANNSVKHPKMPVIASITQPVPNKVFPWQPETQQPTRQAAFMRSEAPASAVADLEVEAEAASESLDGDPDHPGPPPPYSPPPPSEPPSLEQPAQPVDE